MDAPGAIALAVVVLGIAVALVVWRRRRKKGPPPADWSSNKENGPI
jgi:hypothetical protein